MKTVTISLEEFDELRKLADVGKFYKEFKKEIQDHIEYPEPHKHMTYEFARKLRPYIKNDIAVHEIIIKYFT